MPTHTMKETLSLPLCGNMSALWSSMCSNFLYHSIWANPIGLSSCLMIEFDIGDKSSCPYMQRKGLTLCNMVEETPTHKQNPSSSNDNTYFKQDNWHTQNEGGDISFSILWIMRSTLELHMFQFFLIIRCRETLIGILTYLMLEFHIGTNPPTLGWSSEDCSHAIWEEQTPTCQQTSSSHNETPIPNRAVGTLLFTGYLSKD